MQKKLDKELKLRESSRIAVIGGGPAGSFFAVFAFDLAREKGIELEIDVFEPKNFTDTGVQGCNHCGGIVSESLVRMLKTDGIVLPPQVIRRGIESYTLHFENGETVIDSLLHEHRIVSMFRGSGPPGQSNPAIESFDGYLQELCAKKGTKIIHEKVTALERVPDGITLETASLKRKYDLVVGAVGLNPGSLKLFQEIIPAYLPPQTTKTYISEYYLENSAISKHFGNSMHVFLLNLPGIKFGALIPKGNYVTLVLLGSGINAEMVNQFVTSKTVKACFPEGTELKSINPCMCYPYISIKNAENPYDDRVVLIGDSASTKLYKNGIGAAYITAKAAADAAINRGISKKDFKKSYQPVCSGIDRDNAVGKLIFYGTSFIQRSAFLKSVLFKMVDKEQSRERGQREVSLLLWDTFTGSAPYRKIFRRSFKLFILLAWIRNIITELLKPTGKA